MSDVISPTPRPADPPDRPHRLRWRVRLSLRGLMVLVVVLGVPMGWAARRAALQRQAVVRVQALGGKILYADQLDPQGFYRLPHVPWAPGWLRRLVGDEPFQEVEGVVFEPVGGKILIDDESIAVLNGFPGLRRLTIRQQISLEETPPRPVTAAGLARLTGVPRLRELSLYKVGTDAAMVRLLPRWGDLEEVNLIENTIWALDPSCLATLGALPHLKKAQLFSYDAPQAEDIAPLYRLGHLERFALMRSPRDDAGVARLGSVASLTSLQLPQTAFTDATLASLARCPNLACLSFDGSRLGAGALRALSGLTKLTDLAINLGDRSNEPNAHHLIHRVPARFGDDDLDALRGLPLTRLTLMGLDATDVGVARLLAGHRFVMLTLSGRGITDASIPLLVGQAKLETLVLADTSVTDAGLMQLAAAMPGLLTLSLVDNPAVTDTGVAALAIAPKLRYLTLRQPGTQQATLRMVRALRSGFNLFEPPSEPPDRSPR